MPRSADETEQPRPSLAELFWVAFRIGALSFGGGLSGWMFKEFVLRRAWIGEQEFSATLTLSQILPGANVVNLIVVVGERLRGGAGAFSAAFGFLLAPFFAVILLALLFDRIGEAPVFGAFLFGMACTATGMILLVCWRSLLVQKKSMPGLIVVVVLAVLIGALRLPMVPVVAAAVPLSLALAWWRERRNEG